MTSSEPAKRAEKLGRDVRSVESAAIAGVAHSVLTVVALLFLRRFPDLDLSDEEITAWFEDGSHRGELRRRHWPAGSPPP